MEINSQLTWLAFLRVVNYDRSYRPTGDRIKEKPENASKKNVYRPDPRTRRQTHRQDGKTADKQRLLRGQADVYSHAAQKASFLPQNLWEVGHFDGRRPDYRTWRRQHT